MLSHALTRARSNSSWKGYLRTLSWALEWYPYRPFYER